jgi:hypothetical protein
LGVCAQRAACVCACARLCVCVRARARVCLLVVARARARTSRSLCVVLVLVAWTVSWRYADRVSRLPGAVCAPDPPQRLPTQEGASAVMGVGAVDPPQRLPTQEGASAVVGMGAVECVPHCFGGGLVPCPPSRRGSSANTLLAHVVLKRRAPVHKIKDIYNLVHLCIKYRSSSLVLDAKRAVLLPAGRRALYVRH